MEPGWARRRVSEPFAMAFETEPAAAASEHRLAGAPSGGIDPGRVSPGTGSIGVDEETPPMDPTALARSHAGIASIPARSPLAAALATRRPDAFLAQGGQRGRDARIEGGG